MSLQSPATVIDVSQLPAPRAVKALDYDAIVAARGQTLRATFEAHGIAYDAEALQSDPAMILQQVDAYRELLDKAGLNDAVRAVLPAFSTGTDLDHLAARANVVRLEGETDAALLRRYLAAFAAPSAGSEDAYVFHAATAWPQARDIRPLDYTAQGLSLVPGQVDVVLLAAGGQAVPDPAIAAVAAALRPGRARPLTDMVSVRGAQLLPWSVRAHLLVPRGPDPLIIVEEARQRLLALADRRYFIGGEVPANAVPAALYGPNVLRVTIEAPLTDLAAHSDRAPWLEEVELTYEVAP